MRRVRLLALAALTGSLLAIPAKSSATVTIGSNLSTSPNTALTCGGMNQCTFGLTGLSSSNVTGGIASPVNGTVVTWRIKVGPGPADSSPTALRVLRRNGNLYAGAGTSATVTPPVNAITPFSTQLPIQVGDLIGINCCDNGDTGNYFGTALGASTVQFNTRVPEGGAGIPPNFNRTEELLINADIEPTSSFTITKAKPKKGGKIQITAQLPNAGILTAGDKSASLAVAAAGKKTKLLKRASATVGAPGVVSLVVRATKAARSRLADNGKLKAKLKLAFTPTGGAASTQVRKVKLKP